MIYFELTLDLSTSSAGNYFDGIDQIAGIYQCRIGAAAHWQKQCPWKISLGNLLPRFGRDKDYVQVRIYSVVLARCLNLH